MKWFSFLLFVLLSSVSEAQHTLTIRIRTGEGASVAGASILLTPRALRGATDNTGTIIFSDLAAGRYQLTATHIGFADLEREVSLVRSDTVDLELEGAEEEEEEVIVTATRTSRTIAATPLRVEVISGEELEEKANMKPGDIRMMLSESTGIQTQQTSATSYNSSIRIQGLDGRYTQVLRDGYPLYAGFSGGLSIMQIAPLDLRQVEVIKGSSSTLYGGGAIAGLVNLVSKTPGAERDLAFMANGTTARGLDLSGFYSERLGSIGLSMFASANYAAPYDPAGIGLTAIPKFSRYTMTPRVFFYGAKSNADIGISYTTEDRVGGNIDYIKAGSPGYFEENNTDRITARAGFTHVFDGNEKLSIKNSYSRFARRIEVPGYAFEGVQQSTFSEATYSFEKLRSYWIAGANLITDGFKEQRLATGTLRDYSLTTLGLFIQHTWLPTALLTIETGLRGDHTTRYGGALLPRISILYKMSTALTARLGGGAGYKAPTVFNEESERVQFQQVLPVSRSARNERSAGANFDLNYRTNIGAIGLSINQLFFYTRLNRPLVLQSAPNSSLEFVNADGFMDTKGLETNVKLTYNNFKLFIGYTLADVHTHYGGVEQTFPLNAKHRLNNVLMYEVEERWKLGLEAYYTSQQQLSDGTTGRAYWTAGFMAEKLWERFSLFVNFENFTDTRQTRFDTIFTGNIDAPKFRDIYAPVDGFVMNGGFKVKL